MSRKFWSLTAVREVMSNGDFTGGRVELFNPTARSYGRCPDGRGNFATTLARTRKGANSCQ